MKNATLFETLSTDTLSVIVKRIDRNLAGFEADELMSYSPSAHEPFRFFTLLFSENSAFRAAAATLVSKIELNSVYFGTSIDLSTGVLNVGPELLLGEVKEVVLGRHVFSACGPYVRRITVSNVLENTKRQTKLRNNSYPTYSSTVETSKKPRFRDIEPY